MITPVSAMRSAGEGTGKRAVLDEAVLAETVSIPSTKSSIGVAFSIGVEAAAKAVSASEASAAPVALGVVAVGVVTIGAVATASAAVLSVLAPATSFACAGRSDCIFITIPAPKAIPRPKAPQQATKSNAALLKPRFSRGFVAAGTEAAATVAAAAGARATTFSAVASPSSGACDSGCGISGWATGGTGGKGAATAAERSSSDAASFFPCALRARTFSRFSRAAATRSSQEGASNSSAMLAPSAEDPSARPALSVASDTNEYPHGIIPSQLAYERQPLNSLNS